MKVINSENKPIKLWLNNIEEGALEQAKNLANLPFTFKHIAIMPDSHQGYGMPIGGVLATKGVVIPNAVGVDIGAVDKDTEILTEVGWITIDKYNNQKVLVWDNYNQTSFFSNPLLYIVKPCEQFTEYKSKYGLDQVLSDEHRMLVYEGYGKNKKNNTYFCRDFKEKLLKIKKRDYYSVRTTFPTNEKGIDLTDNQLAIMIMVSADGCIRQSNKDSSSVELHLKKQRKINRSKFLLKNANVDFVEYKNSDGIVSIIFTLDWKCEKSLINLYKCNQHQAKIVFDEYLHWDGCIDEKRNHKVYSTTNKTNADVIQYICAINGIRANIHQYSSKNENWKDWYNVYQTNNKYVGFTKPKEIKIPNAKKYCFVVETGYFIARRNGKIFVTGNCGMCAVKTSLTDITPEQIKKIFGGSKEYKGGIRSVVPVGFSHHKRKQDGILMPTVNLNFRNSIVGKEFDSARKQLGTLGGGNHFIEIQKGSDGHIWIMLHSGSRNLGYKVARHYNEIAKELNKKWHTKIDPKWDLAFLPLDSKEGQDYLREMNYCVDFALANRKLMMERIKGSFLEIITKNNVNGLCYNEFIDSFDEMINIAHNYATMENHFGHNVMVHRKGATSARKGQIGIIPGSQGTKSYIIEGLGNPESFMSCSHGAGRTMSRTKARENLNLEEEKKRLDNKGIIHSIRNKKDLDEASSAYKDIDIVMENQKDLVKILVELEPLGVIKG